MVAGESGDLNEQQFYDLLDRIGFVLDDKKKNSIMSICDTDHSGEVQIEEFMEFLTEVWL
jgi:Ca2+-binding EF-hand superfamily protein